MNKLYGSPYKSPMRRFSHDGLSDKESSPEVSRLKSLMKSKINVARKSVVDSPKKENVQSAESEIEVKLKRGTTVKLCPSCVAANKELEEEILKTLKAKEAALEKKTRGRRSSIGTNKSNENKENAAPAKETKVIQRRKTRSQKEESQAPPDDTSHVNVETESQNSEENLKNTDDVFDLQPIEKKVVKRPRQRASKKLKEGDQPAEQPKEKSTKPRQRASKKHQKKVQTDTNSNANEDGGKTKTEDQQAIENQENVEVSEKSCNFAAVAKINIQENLNTSNHKNTILDTEPKIDDENLQSSEKNSNDTNYEVDIVINNALHDDNNKNTDQEYNSMTGMNDDEENSSIFNERSESMENIRDNIECIINMLDSQLDSATNTTNNRSSQLNVSTTPLDTNLSDINDHSMNNLSVHSATVEDNVNYLLSPNDSGIVKTEPISEYDDTVITTQPMEDSCENICDLSLSKIVENCPLSCTPDFTNPQSPKTSSNLDEQTSNEVNTMINNEITKNSSKDGYMNQEKNSENCIAKSMEPEENVLILESTASEETNENHNVTENGMSPTNDKKRSKRAKDKREPEVKDTSVDKKKSPKNAKAKSEDDENDKIVEKNKSSKLSKQRNSKEKKEAKAAKRKLKTDMMMAKAMSEMSKHFAQVYIGKIDEMHMGSNVFNMDSDNSSSDECSSSCSCNFTGTSDSDSSECECWECLMQATSNTDTSTESSSDSDTEPECSTSSSDDN